MDYGYQKHYEDHELYNKVSILINEYLESQKYKKNDPEQFIECVKDCKNMVQMKCNELNGLIWLEFYEYIRDLKSMNKE